MGVRKGGNMARPFGPMTAQIENVIRAEARGEPHNDILAKYMGITAESTPQARHAAQAKMARWRHRPDYKAVWDDEMKLRVVRGLSSAVNRIERQIDNNNEWLANKAANDYITLAKSVGVIQNESTALEVKVMGMPDMGSPDTE